VNEVGICREKDGVEQTSDCYVDKYLNHKFGFLSFDVGKGERKTNRVAAEWISELEI